MSEQEFGRLVKQKNKEQFKTIQDQNLTQERVEELVKDLQMFDLAEEQQTPNVIPEEENMFVDKKKNKTNTSYSFKGLKGGTFRNQKEEQKKIRAQVDLQRKVRRDAEIKDGDKPMETSKTYNASINAITGYADMDFDSTTHLEQGEKLTKARKQIKTSITALQEKIEKETNPAKKAILQKELDNLNNYKNQFDDSADGKLDIPEDTPEAWKMDHTQNMKLHSIKFGIGPSWSDFSDQPLFAHEPSFGDIKQRMIGDCYMEAALVSQLHADPEKIKECMKDNENGTVTVRFYKDCEEKSDLLPEIRESLQKDDITEMTDGEMLLKLFDKMTSLGEDGVDLLTEMTKASRKATFSAENKKLKALESADPRDEEAVKKQTAIVKRIRSLNSEDNTEAVLKFFNMTDQFSKHAQKLKSLADSMAENEQLKDALQQVRDFAKTKNTTDFDLGDLVNAVGRLLMAAENNLEDALNRDFSSEINEIKTGKADVRPLYVTVTKEVPTILGKPVYSSGAMWVHMMQKAYAASGLHNTDEEYRNKLDEEIREKYKSEIDKIRNKTSDRDKNFEESERFIREKVDAMYAEYKDSYQRIEGGHSSEFLRQLTGQKDNSTDIQALNAVNAEKFFNGVSDALAKERTGVLAADPIPAVANYLRGALQQRIKDKHLLKHTKKGKVTEYCTGPISFEEVHEDLFSIEQWLPADIMENLTESYNGKVKFKAEVEQAKGEGYHFPDSAKECIALAKEMLLRLLQQSYDGITLQYGAFATKQNADGTQSAAYTPSAETCYENIKKALADNIPLAMGTKDFIPKEVSSSGLNDEGASNGLVERHAYTIIGTQEIDGRKFIQLRNPWGFQIRGYEKIVTPGAKGEPPTVTYQPKKVSLLDNSQKGQFLMELNDFVSRVHEIYGIKDAMKPQGGGTV